MCQVTDEFTWSQDPGQQLCGEGCMFDVGDGFDRFRITIGMLGEVLQRHKETQMDKTATRFLMPAILSRPQR